MEALKNEELLRLAREESNEDAKEYFFKRNDPFCYHIANKYKNIAELDDLLSLAKIGMVKAFNSFDLSKGFKFATYASRLMINEILMYDRKNKKHKKVGSIHNILARDNDGNELTIEDVVPTPEKDGPSKEDFEILEQVLSEFSKIASDRDKQILKLFYFDGIKQREIGKRLDVSQSYISRILKKIEERLQKIGVQKTEIERTDKMARTNIGKEGYLYIFQNYMYIGNTAIAKILGTSVAAISKQKAKYSAGDYDNVIPILSDEFKVKFEKYAPSKRVRKSAMQVREEIAVKTNTPGLVGDNYGMEIIEPIVLEEPQFPNITEEPDFSFNKNIKKESIILNNKIDIMSNKDEVSSIIYGIYSLIANMPINSKAKLKLEVEVSQE